MTLCVYSFQSGQRCIREVLDGFFEPEGHDTYVRAEVSTCATAGKSLPDLHGQCASAMTSEASPRPPTCGRRNHELQRCINYTWLFLKSCLCSCDIISSLLCSFPAAQSGIWKLATPHGTSVHFPACQATSILFTTLRYRIY